jgi:solute carrier family 25, member 44
VTRVALALVRKMAATATALDDALARVHAGKFFVVGWAIGVAECTAFYPLEVLKTRQQFETRPPGGGAPPAAASTAAARRDASWRLVRELRQLVRDHGWRAAYRGLAWDACVGVPCDVLHYYLYTACKTRLLQTDVGRAWPTLAYTGAAVAADVVSLTIAVPTEVITKRMQVVGLPQVATATASPIPVPALGGFDVVRRILATEGPRGLFRGLGMVASVHVPAAALWWSVSEQSKDAFAPLLARDRESLWVHAAAGALAGAVTTVAMNPLDVLKTRLQATETRLPLLTHLQRIRAEDGLVAGLARGLQPRLLSNIPRSSLAFVLYQLVVHASSVPWA